MITKNKAFAYFESGRLIRGTLTALLKLIGESTADLCIVNLSTKQTRKLSENYATLNKVMNLIWLLTKKNGVCCLILTEDVDVKTDTMNMKSIKNFFKLSESKDFLWKSVEEIMWVKTKKTHSDKIDNNLIDFKETPFSQIYILKKSNSKTFKQKNLHRLSISPLQKAEWMDSVWFVEPLSVKGYKDHLPAEIIKRFIFLFSSPKSVILDPFAGQGIVCKIAKMYGRNFICVEQNSKNISIIKKRIKS